MSSLLPLDAAPHALVDVLRARGFERLTAIQSVVLSPAAAGRDLRILSPTGSGKTIALGFVLVPAVEGPPPEGRSSIAQPTALVIAPTRELASQLGRELGWLYAPLQASVVVVTGGTSIDQERMRLGRAPRIVVGTPGRLLDHLRRGNLALDAVRAIALDEADEMLDMGFEEDLDAILAFAPKDRRTHLMSATFGPHVVAMAQRVQSNALVLSGAAAGAVNEDIDHVVMLVDLDDRLDALVNVLLRYPEDKTLAFVRTRADAQGLARALGELGFVVRALSGDMGQADRMRTFVEFRSGKAKLLVATDVAARGLDIDDVSRVVHVDLPENPDVLTHRSGRTGRAGRRGQSVLFVPPRAEAKARALVRAARVQARVVDVPTPAEIQASADERLQRAMRDDRESVDERALEVARGLVGDRDPLEVVAWLLARSEHAGPCAPREVRRPAPRAPSEPRRAPREGGAPSRLPPARDEFVRFQVSWGTETGADPRRLLAVVCRRGDIGRADVGAISVIARSAMVEVRAEVAARFEQAVARPDPRDPRVRFRRWDAPAPRAGRSSGDKPPRRAPAGRAR